MARSLTSARGYDTLLRVARPRVIALTLAKHGALSVLLFAPPLLWAAYEEAWELTAGLAIGVCAGLLAMLSVWRAPLPNDLRQIEAMMSVALMFFLASLLAVPAFLMLGMPPVSALFESMSAITTTGLSVAEDPDTWPFAAHVLRSWMQWCGGLAMATAVLALLLGPGPATRRLGRAGIDQGDRIASTRIQARQLLAAYGALTVLGVVVLALTAPSAREGFVLALSAVSTGGFAPRTTSLGDYTLLTQTLVIVFSVLGALSLLTIALVARGDVKGAWGLGSVQRVLVALLVSGAALGAWHMSQGLSSTETWQRVLDLWSGLSTAGFSTGAMPVAGPALVLFLAVMIIGADEGSTGGGLKLSRLALLGRSVRHGLALPRLPDSAVAPLQSRGEAVSQRRLVGLLALILLYFGTAGLVWALFSAHGYDPGPALFDTLSALSTVGLSTIVGSELPDTLQLALVFAMWLGRLEFIAVLLLVLPRSWYHP